MGNIADPRERGGLANPSAYLEANPGVWPSRRYVSTDAWENPYFGNDWFSVFRGGGARCSILEKGPNLKPLSD